VEKKNKGTWVFFSCQAFLYDEEGKPRHPLYVEIKYKDTLLKPAKLYSYTGSKKNYGYGEKVALLGGENNNKWKKETYCVKDILVKNNLYSFRIDTHGCINPLLIASIKVFMKVKSDFGLKISSGNNLILIGNIENNRLISNLSKKGSCTYDKLLEDVDSSYPGKGRGIIQICESINKPYFCPTDRGRDAILISGSDEKGIEVAIKRFMKIIKQL